MTIANSQVFASTSPEQEIDCLAQNIYFEARSEPLDGQLAVAHVVVNRVADKRFPNSVCEVVYEARVSKWHEKNTGKVVPLRNQCQFSWYCDGKPDIVRKDSKQWKTAKALAHVVYYMAVQYNYAVDKTSGSTHYHADYVNPRWANTMVRVVKIGRHIFYRWD